MLEESSKHCIRELKISWRNSVEIPDTTIAKIFLDGSLKKKNLDEIPEAMHSGISTEILGETPEKKYPGNS